MLSLAEVMTEDVVDDQDMIEGVDQVPEGRHARPQCLFRRCRDHGLECDPIGLLLVLKKHHESVCRPSRDGSRAGRDQGDSFKTSHLRAPNS
jgi:hypothetical protein